MMYRQFHCPENACDVFIELKMNEVLKVNVNRVMSRNVFQLQTKLY